jgi:hypothetical protein
MFSFHVINMYLVISGIRSRQRSLKFLALDAKGNLVGTVYLHQRSVRQASISHAFRYRLRDE